MHLIAMDWVIVAIIMAICFLPAFFFSKRSGKDTAEFFASGRSVPWWLAGLSMVATTFSIVCVSGSMITICAAYPNAEWMVGFG